MPKTIFFMKMFFGITSEGENGHLRSTGLVNTAGIDHVYNVFSLEVVMFRLVSFNLSIVYNLLFHILLDHNRDMTDSGSICKLKSAVSETL